MKKKLKLFATIASLCLALAVLCFGVFSAMNVTYTIGGSISYEVNDVFATVETDVYTSSFSNSTSLLSEAKKFLTSSNVENTVQTDYKYDFTTKGLDSENYSNLDALEDNTTGGINIAYNLTDKRTYFVVISITNNGDNIISASVTGSMGQNANTNFVKTEPITSLSKTKKQKIVLAFMINDITQTVESVDFSYVVAIKNGEGEALTGTLNCLTNGQSYDIYGEELETELDINVLTKVCLVADEVYDTEYTDNIIYNFELTGVDLTKYNSIQLDYIDGLTSENEINIMTYKGSIEANSRVLYTDLFARMYDMSENAIISSEIDIDESNLKFGIFIMSDTTERVSNLKITLQNSEINGDFKYTKIKNGKAWKISAKDGDISGNNGIITIPTTYKNLPVKEISAGELDMFGMLNLQKHKKSFNVCNNITKVIIPDSIEVIGDFAFDGCANLMEVEFAGTSKIQTLMGTFLNCSKLTTINLPNSLTSLGDCVFYKCTSLATITLPNNSNFTGLGEDTFNGCTSLVSIILPNGISANVNEFNFGLNVADGTKVTSIIIPKSVKGLNLQGLDSGSNSIKEIILLGDLETESHYGSWLFTPTGGGTATTVSSLSKAGTYTRQ